MDEVAKKLDTVEALMELGLDEVDANFILAIENDELTGDLEEAP